MDTWFALKFFDILDPLVLTSLYREIFNPKIPRRFFEIFNSAAPVVFYSEVSMATIYISNVAKSRLGKASTKRLREFKI